MGQEESGPTEHPGSASPFDEFYLREYPAVVGLLQGLLRSRLVAEELAQETFLVAIKLADEHAEVWQAIRTLPPSQAQVIALHYYEDYSISQIAAALDRAPGTIKAQLHQGRRRLARILGTGPDHGRPT
jgi:DNA-directed RNA polymerase specialized sigma24 family protein